MRGPSEARGSCPYRSQDAPPEVVDRVLAWIRQGYFVGAVAGLWARGQWQWRLRAGWSVAVPRRRILHSGDLFDLASLTKPLVAAALVLAHAGRRWSLEVPIRELDADLTGPWASITLADVLRHTAGYPPWVPLYLVTENAEHRFAWLTRQADDAARDRPAVYSCLDYQWLGLWLERQGLSLVEFLRRLPRPRGARFRFRPPRSVRDRIAGSEVFRRYERHKARSLGYDVTRYSWHLRPNWGRVHDLNAYTLHKGVAANAGLFGNLEGVLTLARMWLADPGPAFISMEDLARYLDVSGSYTLGWQWGIPGIPETRGTWLYHTGFTGVALAVAPEQQRVWVFLTNRIHPRVRRTPMPELRRELFRLSLQLSTSGGGKG